MSLRHCIAHWTGWNQGSVETWWNGERLMVGFRCTCGKLSGVHPSSVTLPELPGPKAQP